MNLHLDGKKVIVTGGTKGLGSALVRAYLAEGSSVTTNYHRDTKATKALFSSIPSEHLSKLAAYCLDTSSAKGAAKLVELARVQFGGIDVLVNNAAVIDDPCKDVFSFNDADFDRILHTNLRGLLYVTRAAMTLMIESGAGRIVNMSSAGVYTGNPKEALYACSKAGVEAATRAFAIHGAKHGITVNAVAPHVIASGMALEKSTDPEVLKRIPLGRAGLEEEVAALVLFLSSDVSAYMTGGVIGLDGGRLLAR